MQVYSTVPRPRGWRSSPAGDCMYTWHAGRRTSAARCSRAVTPCSSPIRARCSCRRAARPSCWYSTCRARPHVRLLLVEDDLMIGRSLQQGLRQDGYAVDWVRDGQAARRALQDESYALLLLDLGLPRLTGRELLAELRRQKNAIPVLIITARDAI